MMTTEVSVVKSNHRHAIGPTPGASDHAGPAAWIHAGNVMNWLKTNRQRKEAGNYPAMGSLLP
ncbi:MAG: hypothetical protein OXE84_14950, partial [Rhodobacteraceae bacterium]|nr:hypothetical protein [Paracoccaceae bacterium]